MLCLPALPGVEEQRHATTLGHVVTVEGREALRGPGVSCPCAPTSSCWPQVFFDIEIDGKPAGARMWGFAGKTTEGAVPCTLTTGTDRTALGLSASCLLPVSRLVTNGC